MVDWNWNTCLHCISGFGRRGINREAAQWVGILFLLGVCVASSNTTVIISIYCCWIALGVCLLGLGFYYTTISWECECISLSPAIIISMQLLTITSSLLLFINVNSLHCPSITLLHVCKPYAIVFASQKGNGTNILSPASAGTYSVSWRW